MVLNRWFLGMLFGMVALLGLVGVSPAQKSSASETTVWDTATLSSSDSDFDEDRLRLLSEGWEPFSTSAYQVGNNNSGFVWHYYLHLRKRVSLAMVQKRLAELRSRKKEDASQSASLHAQSLEKAGYKIASGDAASKALKPFLGSWRVDRVDSFVDVKQSGRTAILKIDSEKEVIYDVCFDKSGNTVLVSQSDVDQTARMKDADLVLYSSGTEIPCIRMKS